MPQLLDKTIEILQIKHIRGPNMWCWVEVLEAWIDIGELEDYPSDKIPGFYDRLVQKLPSLIEHRCSYEERGGFLKRVEEGTWPVHIMEHLTLELQSLAGFAGGFGRARETTDRGIYKLIVASPHEAVTRKAIEYARQLLLSLIQDQTFDLDACVEDLKELIDDLCLGPSTRAIVNAGVQQLIPSIRLSSGNLVQLGYGALQKRIWTAETAQTGAIAETISRDKDLTKSLLSMVGVPIPEGELVDSPEHAWEVAQSIGLPVVVKPQDGNHGRGVFTNLQTEQEITAAYKIAVEEGSGVLVEKFIEGDEHRLLVVGNHLVAAAKGEECKVMGDGVHTILELIELQINSDPRRGSSEDFPLNPVRIDSIAHLELQSQGFEPDSIPPQGKAVLIQRNGNVAFDVTDLVHPSVAKQVVLAAKVVGLDIAGVDLVAKDISKPMEEQGAAIVEVNAGPGLLMHIKPAKGKPREVGRAIIEHLFPNNAVGRIPVLGVSGSSSAKEVADICAYLLKLANYYVGLSTQQGLYFNQHSIQRMNSSEWDSGRRTLMNPMVTAAVIQATPKGIINEGLPYDLCQVGVVTSVDLQQTFPEDSIVEERQLFAVHRTQIDALIPEKGIGILNADEAIAAEIAEINPGKEIIFFSLQEENSIIQKHLAENKKAITTTADAIHLYEGEKLFYTIPLVDIAYIQVQRSNKKMLELMASIAALWAMEIPLETIEAGLEAYSLETSEV
ncbi:cyanophycin synthetase [Polynucleobacter kasalickyi]|uniref:Cyanophycin synthetase n=1 Tax=Polynucleobacter kasalickyi TaxID=1938817 RepID=A0A1W1ZRB0_9BURK|nr:cyanophycin synthetase [Polynucleobacter kasalickyi]SMC50833.1 cyanophycin synthetase [Polynucleobacter kasalickyi]